MKKIIIFICILLFSCKEKDEEQGEWAGEDVYPFGD